MANQSLLHLQIVFEAIYENSYKTASIAITKLHWQNGECPEGKSEMSCTAGAEIQVNPPPCLPWTSPNYDHSLWRFVYKPHSMLIVLSHTTGHFNINCTHVL